MTSIVINEVMIPMADGVKLAADLYMPVNMKVGDNLPVILLTAKQKVVDQYINHIPTLLSMVMSLPALMYAVLEIVKDTLSPMNIQTLNWMMGRLSLTGYQNNNGQMAMWVCLAFLGVVLIQFKWLYATHQR